MQDKVLFGFVVFAVTTFLTIESVPAPRARILWNQIPDNYPEIAQEVMDGIDDLERIMQIDYAKRAADLGINRGISNSNMAKHLMGWAAANYGAAPGRKRRSEKA